MISALQKWIGDNRAVIIAQHVKKTKKAILEEFGIVVDQQDIYNEVYPDKIMHCDDARFISFSVGYRSCFKGCKCYVARVSAAVKVSKSNYSESDSAKILQKRKTTNLSLYGVDNVSKQQYTIDKIRQTKIDRYNDAGYNNRAKSIDTVTARYGVDNVMKVYEFKNKNHIPGRDYNVAQAKLTKDQRYGNAGYNNSDKAKITNLQRYGVTNVSQRNFIPALVSLLSDDIAFEQELLALSLRQFCEKYNTSIHTYYKGIKKFSISLENQFEKDILNTILKFYPIEDIVRRSRSVIKPFELDFYIPRANIAIEANGSYWHSEINGKNSAYHVNKTRLCKDIGIKLIHIWQHEWESKHDIYISILANMLGTTNNNTNNNVLYARQGDIRIVTTTDAALFLNEHHAQGTKSSKIRLGLFINNKLQTLMTFSKARYNKNYQFEIDRLVTAKNTIVVGGASRLFKHFIRTCNPESVITYSDRDMFTGDVYLQLGFTFKHYSAPSYMYTNNYVQFESRLKYQKHKLPLLIDTFDSTMSEWQNMQINGYDRIWNCGNAVYEYIKGN